jgi:hypothetical protein
MAIFSLSWSRGMSRGGAPDARIPVRASASASSLSVFTLTLRYPGACSQDPGALGAEPRA